MTITEETQDPEPAQTQKNWLWVGRILSGMSILMSLILLGWEAYLLPITDALSAQGRMHEGDSDGCFYGLLFVLTIFISPMAAFVSLILGGIGFKLRERTLAIIAWILALATLIPIWEPLMSFFGN